MPANGVLAMLSTGRSLKRDCIALRMAASSAHTVAACRASSATIPPRSFRDIFLPLLVFVVAGSGDRLSHQEVFELRLPVDQLQSRVARLRYPDTLGRKKFLQGVGRELHRGDVFPARALVAPQQRIIAAIVARFPALERGRELARVAEAEIYALP